MLYYQCSFGVRYKMYTPYLASEAMYNICGTDASDDAHERTKLYYTQCDLHRYFCLAFDLEKSLGKS